MDLSTLTPVFLGFLPKKVLARPEWLKCEAVVEICSVSQCMSPAPVGWIDKWLHNEAGFYDTVELALSIIEEGRGGEYRVFAFREWPLRFAGGEVDTDWNPAARFTSSRPAPDLSAWAFRGYDLVGRSVSDFFECSPLSCNGMAAEHPVNRHCLIPDLEQAISAGREFSRPESGVEPADYFLLEVLEQP